MPLLKQRHVGALNTSRVRKKAEKVDVVESIGKFGIFPTSSRHMKPEAVGPSMGKISRKCSCESDPSHRTLNIFHLHSELSLGARHSRVADVSIEQPFRERMEVNYCQGIMSKFAPGLADSPSTAT